MSNNFLRKSFGSKSVSGWYILLLYSLLSLILRFFTFLPSVLDHDESTYLEIARMILEGKLLYVDMVDIKPPGIFLILAGFQALFGQSIFMMRLLTALWIAFTAFLVHKSAIILFKDKRAAFAGGTIYIFFISTWTFYGLSLTPEIYFNLFTILSCFVLLRFRTALAFFTAGIIAGAGFIVKYLVVTDFIAIVVFIIYLNNQNEKKPKLVKILLNMVLAGIGFMIPFFIFNLIYLNNGHFEELLNIVYLAPSRYPSPFEPWKMLKYILSFHLLFLPVFFFYYYVLLDKSLQQIEWRRIKIFLIAWTLISLVAVIAAGNTFGHYTIQLMLPVSMTAGLFFHSGHQLPVYLQKSFSSRNLQITLILLTIIISSIKIEYILKQDTPREIAEYLKPRLKDQDVVYAGNYHHVLYYLLKKDSPTKYVHRSLLFLDKHIKALNIDVNEEFVKIRSQRPAYIIVQKQLPNEMMADLIRNNYELENEFGDSILVYRIKK